MDELERALRTVLTDDRLDVPVHPDAVATVRAGVRRRQRRRTALTAGSAALVVAAAITGTALALGSQDSEGIKPIPPATATPTPVPSPTQAEKPPLPPTRTWEVAWRETAYDPAKPPVFPGSVPEPGVPWCTANALTLDAQFQGATGDWVGGARITNTSSASCAVQGAPVVRILAGSQVLVTSTAPDSFFATPWVAVKPHGTTYATIDWHQEFCHEPDPTTIAVDLPHGGGTLTGSMHGTPRCNAQGDPPSAGTLSVDAFGADDRWTPETTLDAEPVQNNVSVVAGGVLSYQVRLTATGRPVRLSPCLPFRERLVGDFGHVVAEASYLLNCDGAPDPLGGGPSGGDVAVFDMQLDVPQTVPPGTYEIVWQSALTQVSTFVDTVRVTTAPACTSDQLTVTDGGNGAATGHYVQTIVIRNVATQPCTLLGYPGVQFIDSVGGILVTTPHHGGSFTFPDFGPHTVLLAGHGGAASFDLGGPDWNPATGGTCPDAYGVKVIPPGLRQQVLVRIHWPYCNNGHVDVSAVVAGARGPRQ